MCSNCFEQLVWKLLASIYVNYIFLQQKLAKLRHWSEQVRNFDLSYVTENGLFFIDCSNIHEGLLPQVEAIYQDLLSFVADEAQSLAHNFMDEMTTVLKVSMFYYVFISFYFIFFLIYKYCIYKGTSNFCTKRG